MEEYAHKKCIWPVWLHPKMTCVVGCAENVLLSRQLKMNESKVTAKSVSLKPRSVWLCFGMTLTTLNPWRKYSCVMTD